ncbi:hypothetical protein [Nocardia farcinica]|uniref:hypothetical protein n=1 Tax=Nocardia farcinica TaxID=37329 RepID=UPI0024581793|nr:hypothetical protein [Nocardia farcinica]
MRPDLIPADWTSASWRPGDHRHILTPAVEQVGDLIGEVYIDPHGTIRAAVHTVLVVDHATELELDADGFATFADARAWAVDTIDHLTHHLAA